jgi:hypothetical protein
MRDLLLVIVLAGAGYLVYDDFYKQRPALKQAQTEIQQLKQYPVAGQSSVPGRQAARAPISVFNPTPPSWFQERVREGSSLDGAHQHKQKEERDSPHP